MKPKAIHTRVLSINNSEAIPIALRILDAGGLIAFPTDTVYGLAARVFDPNGIERLYLVKERDTAKAIAVLIGNLEQLSQVALEVNDQALQLVRRFWPGALTLVVTRCPELPAILSPMPTVGVRMPDFPFTLQLLQKSGPLATTSANLSGLTNPLTAQDVMDQLHDRVELILDGGKAPGGIPSTVVDCTVSPPVLLRQGAIPASELFK